MRVPVSGASADELALGIGRVRDEMGRELMRLSVEGFQEALLGCASPQTKVKARRGVRLELTPEAGELAPRPGKLAELKRRPDARALWGHVFYFEKWKGTMDYPEYRARGWPIASSSLESACGQMGDRVKHARMRWTRRRAEAVRQVKGAVLSQDGRWERRWPAPIPALELPALAYPSAAA